MLDFNTSLLFSSEVLLDVIKEVGCEVSGAKVEYISCEQNSEQNHDNENGHNLF